MKQGEQQPRQTVTSGTFQIRRIPAFVYWLCAAAVSALIVAGVIYFIARSEQPGPIHSAPAQGVQPVTLLDKGRLALSKASTPQEKAIAYEDLGNAYVNTNDPKDAVVAFGHALDYDPKSIGLLSELSSTYLQLGDKERAIDALNRLVIILSQSKDPSVQALAAQYKGEITQLKGTV